MALFNFFIIMEDSEQLQQIRSNVIQHLSLPTKDPAFVEHITGILS